MDRFTEGYIMLLRPFRFANLSIQKLTILYAFFEQKMFEYHLSDEQEKELIQLEFEQDNLLAMAALERKEAINERYDAKKDAIRYDRARLVKKYVGAKIECTINKINVSFMPGEYTIIPEDRIVNEYIESYHCVTTRELEANKDFNNKKFYLLSRGVPDHVATSFCAFEFKGLCYYKPPLPLLEYYCRPEEIIKDDFYKNIEYSFDK